MKKLIILVGLVFLVSCGSGGGGGSSNIPVNESGFPNVAGTYTYTQNSALLTCSDGVQVVELETESVSDNITITQTGNVLEMSSSLGLPEGVNVLSSTDASCFVQKDSTFSCSGGGATYTQSGVEGTITINTNENGEFTDNGWSGTSAVSFVFNGLGVNCTGKTTFKGDKF